MQQLSFLPGEMTPGERSLIQRALKTLDRHLHEPGVAFTSTLTLIHIPEPTRLLSLSFAVFFLKKTKQQHQGTSLTVA